MVTRFNIFLIIFFVFSLCSCASKTSIPLSEEVQQENLNSEDYITRGLSYNERGQYDEAISAFNKAIKLNPKNDIAFYNRGEAWDYKGDYDRAIADYSKVRFYQGSVN